MSSCDIEELISKYDKLRSIANAGSVDEWGNSKNRTDRVLNSRLFRKFHQYTYDVPFSMGQIRNEIRNTLIIIRSLHSINHLRKNRSDKDSKKAIDIITKYLEELPKKPSFWDKLKTPIRALSYLPSMIFFVISKGYGNDLFPVLIIFGIIAVLVASFFTLPSVVLRITEIWWYKRWMKKLGILELKSYIIQEMVKVNNASYDDLEKNTNN